MDTTTGMSAPPMGRIRSTPSTRASSVNSSSDAKRSWSTKSAPRPRIARAMSRLIRCWPRNTSGRPVISAWSLAKATSEPVQVTVPMKLPAKSSAMSTPPGAPARACVR